MKEKKPDENRRPRLARETLRGLGFDDLEQVNGGGCNPTKHPKPIATRYCIG